MKKHLVRRTTALLAFLLAGATFSPAIAGDAAEGKALIEQWCDGCHLSGTTGRASDVGPPFAQIANDQAYSDERLRGWLHDPHPPMPKFELDRRRIDNIIAYIRSLKR